MSSAGYMHIEQQSEEAEPWWGRPPTDEEKAKLSTFDRLCWVMLLKMVLILKMCNGVIFRLVDTGMDVYTACRFASLGHVWWASFAALFTITGPIAQSIATRSLKYLIPFSFWHLRREYMVIRFVYKVPQARIYEGIHTVSGGRLNEVLAGLECLFESLPQAAIQLRAFCVLGGTPLTIMSLSTSIAAATMGVVFGAKQLLKARAVEEKSAGWESGVPGRKESLVGQLLLKDCMIDYRTAEALGELIRRDRELREMSIFNCSVSAETMELLMMGIADGCPALRSLCIVGDEIMGFEHIHAAIANLDKLEELRLHPAEDGRGLPARQLLSALRGKRRLRFCQLHRLRNEEGGRLEDADHAALGMALQDCTSLEEVDLTECYLGTSGAEHLAAALAGQRGLRVLSLHAADDEGMGPEGMEHIVKVIQHQADLEVLGLTQNLIGAVGAQHLATALMGKAKLKALALGDTGIGAVGAEHLADAIAGLRALCDLQVGYNDLGPQGAEHLGRALAASEAPLQALNIMQNELGEIGAQHLATALVGKDKLQALKIDGNDIGDVGAQHLAEALKGMDQLESVDLRWNNLTAEGKEQFRAASGLRPEVLAI